MNGALRMASLRDITASPQSGQDTPAIAPESGLDITPTPMNASIAPTRRDEILALLGGLHDEIVDRFGVRHVSLFGSAARDELRPDSDVDVLVEFEGPSSFDAYFGLKDYLQARIGRRVDLVTTRGLKPRARAHVEQDLIRVA